MTKTCGRCGAKNADYKNYCTSCGGKLGGNKEALRLDTMEIIDTLICHDYIHFDSAGSGPPIWSLWKCPRCSEKNKDSNKFCYKCGFHKKKIDFLVLV